MMQQEANPLSNLCASPVTRDYLLVLTREADDQSLAVERLDTHVSQTTLRDLHNAQLRFSLQMEEARRLTIEKCQQVAEDPELVHVVGDHLAELGFELRCLSDAEWVVEGALTLLSAVLEKEVDVEQGLLDYVKSAPMFLPSRDTRILRVGTLYSCRKDYLGAEGEIAASACKQPVVARAIWEEAVAMASVLDTGHSLFLEGRERYFSELEQIAPGITNLSTGGDFTADLEKSYQELRSFDIEKNIEFFYWAWCLEKAYSAASALPGSLCFSHRRCGHQFREGDPIRQPEFFLNNDESLKLNIRTNFGYGSKSYFYELLEFQGVGLVRFTDVIWYANDAFSEAVSYTRQFPLVEDSFEACFNDAVEKESELSCMGKPAFLEKYAVKPLADMAQLMEEVANRTTFLQMKSEQQLDSLLGRGVQSFSFDAEFCLDENEKALISKLAERISGETDKFDPEEFNDTFAFDESRPLLEQGIRFKAASRELSGSLIARGRSGYFTLDKLKALGVDVDFLDTPWKVLEFNKDEYDVIEFRIGKGKGALNVLASIAPLVDAVPGVRQSYGSITASCVEIAKQAKTYKEQRISSALLSLNGDLARYESRLSELEDSRVGENGDVTDSSKAPLNENASEMTTLRSQIRDIKKAISELHQQQSEIDGYLSRVARIVEQVEK